MTHLHRSSRHRLSAAEIRWPLFAALGALGGFALVRRTRWSAALAGAGIWAVRNAASHAHPRSYSAQATFALNCTQEQAYRVWRDFEGVSRFLHHVHSVRKLDDSRSEWVILGPFDRKFSWIAEIVEDRPNERIAWRSVANSDVETHGTIEFLPRVAGRGILVRARISYSVPAGAAVKSLFAVLGRDPQFNLREDLRRFKSLVEAGEVPTVVGQPHGPRGLHGTAFRQVLRERQNATAPQAEMTPPQSGLSEARIA